jgi:hypothetical protein
MTETPSDWAEHDHEGVVHRHEHFHVTHNFNRMTGAFEHLMSSHAHEHDHAALHHAHVPHRDFEHEHEGEAHVHDHDQPVSPGEAT